MKADRIFSVLKISLMVAQGNLATQNLIFFTEKYFSQKKKLFKWKMICDYFAYFVMRLLGVLYFPENRAACHNSRDESRI